MLDIMPKSFSVPSSGLRRSGRVLLCAFVLLVTLCSFFVYEVFHLKGLMDDLRGNDTARTEIRNILVDLLDAETGQRGFLLTGDVQYLEPYTRARRHIRQTLRTAEETGLADARFKATVVKLMLLTESKLGELERTVLLKKRDDTEGAMAIVVAGFGKETMDQARHVIQQELDRLRSARDHTMAELDHRYTRSAVLLLCMMSAVVLLATHAWRSLSSSARATTAMANRLAREASHDQLTDLPNRRFFKRWAEQLMAKYRREKTPFTLMLIDLDGFKKVNDVHGHGIGDEVLKEATARFRASLRESEFLARLGGDEFGVLIEGAPSRADLSRLGRRLISSLTPALHPELADGIVGASIGIAFFPQDGEGIECLTAAADSALYESKEHGRGMVSFASSGKLVHAKPAEATAPAAA